MKLYAEFDHNGNKVERMYFGYDPHTIRTRNDILRCWGAKFSKGKVPLVFNPENIVAEAEPYEPGFATVVYAILFGFVGWGFYEDLIGTIAGFILGAALGYNAAYFGNKKEIKRVQKFNQSTTTYGHRK